MAAKAKARTKAKPKARSKARSGGKAVRAGAGGRPDSTRTAKGNGQPRDLLSRLAAGAVVCAEGYVFELERRGYLQAGAFVPEVLFDHPEVVEQLHMDFVHAGSDVTQALTYYVHREKLRVIGREKDLVPMNRAALRIAKSVARRTGTLFAGDICNTNIYDPADKASVREVERIYHEQVGWAVEAGVDRSEEHTSELQSPDHLVCRLLLEKKKKTEKAKVKRIRREKTMDEARGR